MQNISRPTVTKLGVINEDEPLIHASPITTSASTPVLPPPTKYVPAGTIANTPFHASFISWALGGLFWTSLLCGVTALCVREGWISGLTVEMVFGSGRWTRCIRPQLGLYLASWSLFHILEFWTTATCNVEKLSVDGKLHSCLPSLLPIADCFFRLPYSLPVEQRRAISRSPYYRVDRILCHRTLGRRDCSNIKQHHPLQKMVDGPRIPPHWSVSRRRHYASKADS
jgi:hypothetical protein